MAAYGEAVLITGVYGTGKTSVCKELAERLESAGVAYGAIDLDWLGWFTAPQLDAAAVQRTHLDNLAAIATNCADAGVRRLVLAGAVRSNAVLDATRAAIPFQLRVVRLTLPLDEIERRLSGAVHGRPCAGCAQREPVARAWHRCRRRRPGHRQRSADPRRRGPDPAVAGLAMRYRSPSATLTPAPRARSDHRIAGG